MGMHETNWSSSGEGITRNPEGRAIGFHLTIFIETRNVGKKPTESNLRPLSRPHNSGAEPGVVVFRIKILILTILSLMLLRVHLYSSFSFFFVNCPYLHIQICPCTTTLQGLLKSISKVIYLCFDLKLKTFKEPDYTVI